ncbi:CENPX protein, partial [Rhinopomastus cyanomelas]|nr:CENPX protein [Rhinopomastus cyanomelas]
ITSLLLSAQETVEQLLRLHFRDGRTRVNGDAQLLMAEMLKVFVRGECAAAAAAEASPPATGIAGNWDPRDPACAAEAAARAARQAQAEELEKVDLEQVEKVLPQLVPHW